MRKPKGKTLRTNNEQKKRLVELLKLYPDVAKGLVNPQRKFRSFAQELNALGPPVREGEAWVKMWHEWRKKLIGYMNKVYDGEEQIHCTALDKELIELLSSKDTLTNWEDKIGNKMQMTQLFKSIQQYPKVARGTCPKAFKIETFKNLAVELNALGPPKYKWNEWFKVWIHWKRKCLRRTVSDQQEPSNEEVRLREWQEMMIKMLYCKASSSRRPKEDEPASDEESELESSGLDDDDADCVESITTDKVDIPDEPLNLPSTSENIIMEIEAKEQDLEGCNEENSTIKIEPASPREYKEEIIEAGDLEKQQNDSSDSFMENVQEFSNIKSELHIIKDEHEKILRDQILVEEQFHNKMLNFMGEVKTSMQNIEGYLRMSFENKNALIEVKKETLDAYVQAKVEKSSYTQTKIRLKAQLLDNKRRKLNEILEKTEI